MKYLKAVSCPVVWKCYSLNEELIVDRDAVYNVNSGWLCKCGEWVKKASRSHEILLMGFRDGVKREKNDKKIFSNEIKIKCVCCECGNPTNRDINGVYVCNECYDYDYVEVYGYKSYFSNDFVTALGLMILNCYVDFNPDKLICKDCNCFRDCSIHHVPIHKKELVNDVRLDDY